MEGRGNAIDHKRLLSTQYAEDYHSSIHLSHLNPGLGLGLGAERTCLLLQATRTQSGPSRSQMTGCFPALTTAPSKSGTLTPWSASKPWRGTPGLSEPWSRQAATCSRGHTTKR